MLPGVPSRQGVRYALPRAQVSRRQVTVMARKASQPEGIVNSHSVLSRLALRSSTRMCVACKMLRYSGLLSGDPQLALGPVNLGSWDPGGESAVNLLWLAVGCHLEHGHDCIVLQFFCYWKISWLRMFYCQSRSCGLRAVSLLTCIRAPLQPDATCVPIVLNDIYSSINPASLAYPLLMSQKSTNVVDMICTSSHTLSLSAGCRAGRRWWHWPAAIPSSEAEQVRNGAGAL